MLSKLGISRTRIGIDHLPLPGNFPLHAVPKNWAACSGRRLSKIIALTHTLLDEPSQGERLIRRQKITQPEQSLQTKRADDAA
jgi:hypothetical protein